MISKNPVVQKAYLSTAMLCPECGHDEFFFARNQRDIFACAFCKATLIYRNGQLNTIVPTFPDAKKFTLNSIEFGDQTTLEGLCEEPTESN